MIQTTIGDLLDNKLDTLDTTDHHLYVVRDGDVIFYVGRSRDVEDRLLGHMGKSGWNWAQGQSSLGRLVEANLPESRDWQIELLTPGECGVPGRRIKAFTREEWEAGQRKLQHILGGLTFDWDERLSRESVYFDDSSINQAEGELITRYHPCLNVIHNREPNPLPERYRATNLEIDAEVTASDFVPWN